MTPFPQDSPIPKPTGRKSGGVVLVITLAFLVLITVLVIAFFTTVSNDYISSRSYSQEAICKELADSAVQLVEGQIRDATTTGSNSGTMMAWASQPGMIRTWNQQGYPNVYYKLYSSGTMQVRFPGSSFTAYNPGVDVPTTGIGATGTGNGYNACYADLNIPTTTGTDVVFPIIDPRAAAIVTPAGSTTGTNMVNGFSFPQNGASGAIAGSNFPGSTTDATARLPMPVQWLYVTQSGQIVAPDAVTSGTGVTFLNATISPGISGTNPIVGRIAFWADDETCKLNVNTAAEGSTWEEPMFSSYPDVAYSQFQPATHEYSRYPGHPATTSLSPVFWSYFANASSSIWTSPLSTLMAIPNPSNPISYDTSGSAVPTLPPYASTYWNAIMQLSPRNVWAGSMAGTQITLAGSNGITTTALDSDRLYASVDEALFAVNPSVTGTAQRVLNFPGPITSGSGQLGPPDLAKLRFFLTANSRAPETNPFNRPKVSMWPNSLPPIVGNSAISGTATSVSVEDSLLAFCYTTGTGAAVTTGSAGAHPYYFTRSDSTSPTNDVTPRNQLLYNYLRGMLNQPIPGFNGGFTTSGNGRRFRPTRSRP